MSFHSQNLSSMLYRLQQNLISFKYISYSTSLIYCIYFMTYLACWRALCHVSMKYISSLFTIDLSCNYFTWQAWCFLTDFFPNRPTVLKFILQSLHRKRKRKDQRWIALCSAHLLKWRKNGEVSGLSVQTSAWFQSGEH